MILEVRHLELVDAIHREGRLTAAAERLHMSQPAASHALRKLERRLDTRLFDRRPDGMRVTAEGRRVLETAERVLGELERTEYDVRLLAGGVRGVVRLSTQCYTGYHWVPDVLLRFRGEYPGVELRLQPEATYRVLEALEAGELDLALMYEPPESGSFSVESILEDEIVAIVPPDHPWTAKTYLEADDFTDATVLVHSDPEGSTLYREVLTPKGVRPAGALELQLTEALVGATRAGMGVGVLARWAAAPALEAGRLAAVRITRSGLHRRWCAVVPAVQADRDYVTRLVELLREHALS